MAWMYLELIAKALNTSSPRSSACAPSDEILALFMPRTELGDEEAATALEAEAPLRTRALSSASAASASAASAAAAGAAAAAAAPLLPMLVEADDADAAAAGDSDDNASDGSSDSDSDGFSRGPAKKTARSPLALREDARRLNAPNFASDGLRIAPYDLARLAATAMAKRTTDEAARIINYRSLWILVAQVRVLSALLVITSSAHSPAARLLVLVLLVVTHV
jgi:hypothetical protein